MTRGWTIAIAVGLALTAGACGGDAEVEGAPASPTAAPSPTPAATATETPLAEGSIEINGAGINFHDAADVRGDASVEMELDDFYFEPSVLLGDPGQTITIDLRNDGSATHTFTLDDQEVDVSLLPEATERVEVTIPEDGAVVFVCRFHEGQGMRGALAGFGTIRLPDDDLERG